jgi:hypothetical protein
MTAAEAELLRRDPESKARARRRAIAGRFRAETAITIEDLAEALLPAPAAGFVEIAEALGDEGGGA